MADAHEAVTQLLSPTRLLGVVSRAPKLTPLTVTLHPIVVATLALPTKLTAGAASDTLGACETVADLSGCFARRHP